MLTIEFKINLLAPAAGRTFPRAIGRVRKSGRSVFVAESDLFAENVIVIRKAGGEHDRHLDGGIPPMR